MPTKYRIELEDDCVEAEHKLIIETDGVPKAQYEYDDYRLDTIRNYRVSGVLDENHKPLASAEDMIKEMQLNQNYLVGKRVEFYRIVTESNRPFGINTVTSLTSFIIKRVNRIHNE